MSIHSKSLGQMCSVTPRQPSNLSQTSPDELTVLCSWQCFIFIAPRVTPCMFHISAHRPKKNSCWRLEVELVACRSFNGESLSAEISQLVMRLVRSYDQDEKEVDIGILYDHLKHESGEFSDQDWLQHIYHGTSNMSLLYCVNSQKSFLVYSCHSRTH